MIFKPDYNVNSLFDIDFKELKSIGIKALIFDLDSTVMPSKTGVFPKEVLKLFEELENNFILAIISNNSNDEYIDKVKSQVRFYVKGNAKKPSPKAMRDFLKTVNIAPYETAVIGDRPLTDIWSGVRLRAKTVLVDSITKDTENKPTRFVRFLERLVIKRK